MMFAKCKFGRWIGLGMLVSLGSLLPPSVAIAAKAAAVKTIVLWHSYRAEEKRALETVVQTFNAKNKQLQVKALAIPYDAYADKISAAIPRGHGPDLFIFAHDRIGDWSKNKILEPITFWVNQELLSRFFPKTVQMLAYENALYGLPMAYKSLALFYNKALLKKPPTTTQALIALAKSMTHPKKNQFGFAYETNNFYQHAAWLYGFGGKVFGNGNTLLLDKPISVKALDFARALKHTHKILPSEPTSHLISSLFNQGKLAMVFNGPWFRGEISQKIQYGVVPLPLISGTKRHMAPFLTSEAILLSKFSKHKRDAFKVMTYLTSKASAMTRLKLGKQTVANIACYQSKFAKQDPILQAFLAQMKHAVAMPNTPEMQMVWSPMVNALSKAFRSPKESSLVILQQAQREISNYLKKKGS